MDENAANVQEPGNFRAVLAPHRSLSPTGFVVLMSAVGLVSFVAGLAFFLIGAAQSGYLMSTSNIVLEYGHRHDVPMRMALSNTAEGAMGALAPLLGAGLVVWVGYEASFCATIVTMAVALGVLVWKVEEPRRKRLANHIEPDGK